MLLTDAGDQDSLLGLENDGGNLRDLCRCLALAKDDFRKSLPNGPVSVDFGEVELLKRGGLKSAHHRIPREDSFLELVEEFVGFNSGHAQELSGTAGTVTRFIKRGGKHAC